MKRRMALLLTALLLLATTLSACSSGSTAPAAPPPGPDTPQHEPATVPMEMGGDGSMSAESLDSALSYDSAPAESASGDAMRESKLIRSAWLSVQTLDFDGTTAALEALTARLGGYYEQASVSGGDYYSKNAMRSATYTIRVPKEQYAAFLSGAGEVGHVVSSSERQEDVGEAYYDTELRLRTQQVKQERLLALLEKADKMEDIISLESALSEVQYQIEQYSSSLQRYDSLVDFATIDVELSEVLEIEDTPVQTLNFWTRLGGSFTDGMAGVGRAVQDLVLWLAYNLVGVAVFAAAAVGVLVVVRKKYRRPPPPPPSDQK